MDAGLYIHFPFCIRKCSYCDFFSIKADHEKVTRFLNMLKREILLYSEQSVIRDFQFRTLYIGGGTPSILSAQQINELMETLGRNFSMQGDAEVTIEVNPETVDLQVLSEFRNAGINRVSIGIQSFNSGELDVLKRVHSAETAVACIRQSQQAGFDNVSLDLIFGIPGQTRSVWLKTLDQAIALSPQHVSMYGLTIEKGTLLQRQLSGGQLCGVGESVEREMYLRGIEVLEKANFRHYEVSNAAIPGYECLHNMMYWDGSPYLGLGPAAHSFWNTRRQWNVRNLKKYFIVLEKDELPVENFEDLTAEQQITEFILLGLRRREGIDLVNFRHQFNIDFLRHYHQVIEKLMTHEEELIRIEDDFLRLTPHGFVLYDEILYKFVD